MTTLALVTVCYNSNRPLFRLAKSLNEQTIKPSIWLLVDNAPKSDSTLEPGTSFPTVILTNNEGDGFGKGCNAGLEYLQERHFSGWVWILNPDTLLKSCNHIKDLLGELNTLDTQTLLGTAIENEKLQLEQSAGWIRQGLGYRKSQINQKVVSKDSGHGIEVDWVSGCNLLFRPSSFYKPLRFDPHFPLYFEDIDFCLRAKIQGGKCIWINSLRIYHQKSTGSKCSSLRRERLKTISQIRFLFRYQPWWAVFAHTVRIVILALARLPIQFDASLGVLCGAFQALRNKQI
jgi:N-acetylglucosaminyl-diphospho-decaprenol L-rhamnosyltransferase